MAFHAHCPILHVKNLVRLTWMPWPTTQPVVFPNLRWTGTPGCLLVFSTECSNPFPGLEGCKLAVHQLEALSGSADWTEMSFAQQLARHTPALGVPSLSPSPGTLQILQEELQKPWVCMLQEPLYQCSYFELSSQRCQCCMTAQTRLPIISSQWTIMIQAVALFQVKYSVSEKSISTSCAWGSWLDASRTKFWVQASDHSSHLGGSKVSPTSSHHGIVCVLQSVATNTSAKY